MKFRSKGEVVVTKCIPKTDSKNYVFQNSNRGLSAGPGAPGQPASRAHFSDKKQLLEQFFKQLVEQLFEHLFDQLFEQLFEQLFKQFVRVIASTNVRTLDSVIVRSLVLLIVRALVSNTFRIDVSC